MQTQTSSDQALNIHSVQQTHDIEQYPTVMEFFRDKSQKSSLCPNSQNIMTIRFVHKLADYHCSHAVIQIFMWSGLGTARKNWLSQVFPRKDMVNKFTWYKQKYLPALMSLSHIEQIIRKYRNSFFMIKFQIFQRLRCSS